MLEEVIAITQETDVAYVQLRARLFARGAGLGVREQWAVAIAASELSTNVLKFGPPGSLTLRLSEGPPRRLELEAVDRGPGFEDLEGALRDGVSEGIDRTAPEASVARGRGLGLGLGAVKRLMGELTVQPRPLGGSIVVARMELGSGPPRG